MKEKTGNRLKRSTMKMLCFILAAIMLIGAFASCKKDPEPIDTDESTSQNTEPYDPESAPTPYMEDFEDYEFRVLTRGSGGWISNDIVGEVMGSTVDQAVYNRNMKVGAQYNFTVSETRKADWGEYARQAALTGSDEDRFDIFAFRLNDMPAFGQEGLIWNLYEVPQLNLDAAYYDQSLLKHGTFANYLFFVTGDLLYQDDLSTHTFYFNHDIWNKDQLGTAVGAESMYELVEDGRWTLEVFEELARLTSKEKNGDSEMDENDQWGFVYQNADIFALNVAAGNRLLQTDDEDIFILNQEEKQFNDLSKILSFLNSGDGMYLGHQTLFSKGNVFIEMNWLKEVSAFKAMGIDFGIVPACKMDSQQENYEVSITAFGSNGITICKSVKDVNKTASIIELLSYESRHSVMPKFYSWLLDGRVVNRAEDSKMIEYLISHRAYELCHLWNTGSLYNAISELNTTKGEGLAHVLESCEEAIAESVARKLERLERLS